MEYRYIGQSGLRVSPVCLGTMTFGSMCDKKTSFAIMDKAYDAGINFLDTAEVYPVPPRANTIGITEEIVGEWLQGKNRDSLIIATKVAGAASGWFVPPVRSGLTAIDAHHIIKGVEGSLRRLKCDYIDLYQMHWPDSVVPREESMEAFDSLVRSGMVRYLGTSNDTAYGTTKSNMIAKYQGYKRFESIQNNFSLLNRRFLDEMVEMCRREKISLLPYSPMAGGVLTGKYNTRQEVAGRFSGYARDNDSRIQAMVSRFVNEKTLASTARYMDIAADAGISSATLAVAWSKQFDFVASTIVGATTPAQLDDSIAAIDFELSEDVLCQCDAVHNEILYPMG
ncbi:putative oxidoreductase, aryl-alcohol dehydrogenase like protein [Desulfocapsa sulfexigens DSM 10523]|uniref:Putative oxidoreductase, aryl-alcohol dehydrogenase like protein n=1 Tax=Desulfocapsa sulfexigens (strain DSM 10523 / SB164P1) TaxID=1167006 RepID=M1NEA9_DESSD|nr:aldo/keto reductase [Desulfocapsa sulfexigens]AGF78024.1 putative oxidoreductase, aryl-alcohol dehydrogenase like protein [Desulfocapsa sulfexigens DSM 10523]